ncbi:MAG: carboxyl-terminal processing protease [Thermoleophilaceae bacterium]|jgi:carboxyl-terminal processing protease|nr:carboxyl-terminal processing protease [Thermoleophilaceae bacterium]
MHPRSRTALVAAASALVALVFGIWWGGHPQSLPAFLRDSLVTDDVATRAKLIEDVQANFYKPVSKAQLEEASFKGIVSSLHDQFSSYYTPKEATQLTQSLSGKFDGVGMSVNRGDTKQGLRVARVFPGSPARAAGIRAGDLITGVNGRSIVGETPDVTTAKIRGPAGTKVKLTFRSGGKQAPKTVEVERKKLDVPLVDARIIKRGGHKLAYDRLAEFDAGARDQLRTALEKQLKSGAQGILLDLRGNPGGQLDEGIFVSSLFLANGTPVVSTKGRSQPERKFDASGDPIAAKQPMIVLVDSNSASAAEIVTGALRDNKRATVVGAKTYGKGVFQTLENLPNQGLLKLTVGSYYLPHGENLAGNGIDPTVQAKDDPKTVRRDEALPIATRTLEKKLK